MGGTVSLARDVPGVAAAPKLPTATPGGEPVCPAPHRRTRASALAATARERGRYAAAWSIDNRLAAGDPGLPRLHRECCAPATLGHELALNRSSSPFERSRDSRSLTALEELPEALIIDALVQHAEYERRVDGRRLPVGEIPAPDLRTVRRRLKAAGEVVVLVVFEDQRPGQPIQTVALRAELQRLLARLRGTVLVVDSSGPVPGLSIHMSQVS